MSDFMHLSKEQRVEEVAKNVKFRSEPMSLEEFKMLIKKYGLTFRKNKSLKDVKNAIRKSLKFKNGMGKTEYELQFLVIYLKNDVLKNAPKKKDEDTEDTIDSRVKNFVRLADKFYKDNDKEFTKGAFYNGMYIGITNSHYAILLNDMHKRIKCKMMEHKKPIDFLPIISNYKHKLEVPLDKNEVKKKYKQFRDGLKSLKGQEKIDKKRKTMYYKINGSYFNIEYVYQVTKTLSKSLNLYHDKKAELSPIVLKDIQGNIGLLLPVHPSAVK